MKINVGMFFGGSSVEHEVSVISAIQAIGFLDSEKYTPIPVYITKGGELLTGSNLLKIDNYKELDKLIHSCEKVNLIKKDNEFLLYRIPSKIFGSNILAKIDIAFPIVHGTKCEDGTIQGLFELLGIPYVGCDILSSALGMDKVIMKQVLKQNNLPVLDCISFYAKDWSTKTNDIISQIETNIGYPVIVKPSNLGSSVGIKKANNQVQLEEAISFASTFSVKILVERALQNMREINCSVLGNSETAEASVCEEPIANDEILSYSDKYLSKSSSSKGMSSLKRKIPADLTPTAENTIRQLSIDTFQALGCNGVSRIDYLIDIDDNEKIYINEINTIPGSLSFYLWEASKVSFTTLLDKLIELGFKRDRERKNLMFSFSSNIFSLGGKFGMKK